MSKSLYVYEKREGYPSLEVSACVGLEGCESPALVSKDHYWLIVDNERTIGVIRKDVAVAAIITEDGVPDAPVVGDSGPVPQPGRVWRVGDAVVSKAELDTLPIGATIRDQVGTSGTVTNRSRRPLVDTQGARRAFNYFLEDAPVIVESLPEQEKTQ